MSDNILSDRGADSSVFDSISLNDLASSVTSKRVSNASFLGGYICRCVHAYQHRRRKQGDEGGGRPPPPLDFWFNLKYGKQVWSEIKG